MFRQQIFLTGSTGMLGNYLARELSNKGYSVVALAEPYADTSSICDINNLTIVIGNILDSAFLSEAIRGCDYVIHAAASTSVVPARNKKVIEINLTGTLNIIEACCLNKIKRLVYVGSANSFGFGTMECPGDETKLCNSHSFGLDYIDSKFVAYKKVIEAVRENRINACVVCPTFMFGKFDSGKGSGSMIVAIAKGKLPGYTKGGRNFIYAKDVARAICNCVTMGENGEAYILGHQNLSYQNAFNLIAKTIGVKPPKIKIPGWAALFYGRINEAYCKLIGKNPTVTYALAKISNKGFYYDSTKAVLELQLPQTPIDVAIKECYMWLKTNNHF